MKEIEISIGALVESLAKYKGVDVNPTEFNNCRSFSVDNIEIQDENNKWVAVTHFVTKKDLTRNIIFSNGSKIGCGDSHRICLIDDKCEFSNTIDLNTKLRTANNTEIFVVENSPKLINDTQIEETVYDLTVDSHTHLYQTSNKIIHHNTELIEGLARNINSGDVPATLKDKVIYSLDIGSVLAGCHFRGDFEEKIKNVLSGLVKEKNAILFIDEAQQINVGGGSNDSGVGFSSMLKPELSRGNIKVIAATTWDGYTKTFKTDTALMRRFRVLALSEPSKEEAILILNGIKSSFNKFHKCRIQDDAIIAAVELSVRYQTDRQLPDKAIDLIDSACARKNVSKDKNNKVTKLDIIREIEDSTGISIKTSETSSAIEILNIREKLNEKIFHQEQAINKVAESLIISQAGLRDPARPIGSYLFSGKSGVGKTFLAKQIALQMNMNLLRYDMSEYQAEHAMATLIGAPPGYKGFGDGNAGEGKLINDLMKHPNSVILFDEIEKAHPNMYTLLLQMLDEGTITSAAGKTADCKNTIIIMSSNIGSKEQSKIDVGFIQSKSGKSSVSKAVDNFFLTEIRGRITDIIEFADLDDLSYRKIAQAAISSISELLKDKQLTLIASEDLITHVLELNTSTQYGARKISSIINSLIRYPLSIELLNGNISNGANVKLDWIDNKLIIGNTINTIAIPINKSVLQEK